MFFSKEKQVTAVDISDNFIKIAAVAGDGSKTGLYVLDSVQLSSEKEREVARDVRSAVSRSKLGKTYIVASFPRHLVTIRSVRLPTTDKEEVRNMAQLQAVKHLPYSQEEIISAHKTVGITSDGYTDILLVMAQKKSVDRYVEIFKHAGIRVEKLALSSEGVRNWYSTLEIDDTQPVSIIDFDRHHVNILIIKKKILLFSRSVSFDITDSDADKNVLLREIRMSFDSYLKEKDESVSRIILTGSEDYSKDFSSFLSRNISIPCAHAGQLTKIPLKGPSDKYSQRAKDASYTHLIGIASQPETLEVDLLPRDIVETRKEKAVKNDLVKTAILFLAVIVAAFGIMEKKMSEKRRYLQKMEGRLKAIEPEVKRLSKLKENIELIRGQLAFEGSSIDILREVYEILPAGVSLTILEFEDKNRILLRGTTKELSEVFRLLPLLEKSPHFENVKINYATKRTFRSVEFADFEIVCALR